MRRIGAYGVVRDGAGRVVLARSSERSDVVGMWYLPGGGVEHGEDPADTVVREAAEETGLEMTVTGLRSVVSDVLELPARAQSLHTDRILYDLRTVGGTLRDETAGTTDTARWVPVAEAARLPLMPFVATTLGLPATAPRVRDDVPPGEVLTAPPERPARGQRLAAYGWVTDGDGRVLLTLNAPGYPGAGRWHLPGGGTDHGEAPVDGVLREVYEETGQRGTVTDLLGVNSHRIPDALGPEGYPLDWHQVGVLYRVFVAEPGEPTVLDAGGSTARAAWFTVDEVAVAGGPAVTEAVAWALRRVRGTLP